MNPAETQTSICIHKHLLKDVWMFSFGSHGDAVGPALNRRSVMWGNSTDQRVPRPIKGGSYWCAYAVTLIMPSEMSVFVVYGVVCCEQACLYGNGRFGKRASFVFFQCINIFFICCIRPLTTTTLRAPPPPPQKLGTNFIFWLLLVGYPQICLKLAGRVAQTSVAAIRWPSPSN